MDGGLNRFFNGKRVGGGWMKYGHSCTPKQGVGGVNGQTAQWEKRTLSKKESELFRKRIYLGHSNDRESGAGKILYTAARENKRRGRNLSRDEKRSWRNEWKDRTRNADLEVLARNMKSPLGLKPTLP